MIYVSCLSPALLPDSPAVQADGLPEALDAAHRIFTVAAARVGGLLWPNTGTSVPASAPSGHHDLLAASWWKAVREKKPNNWCLMRALSVTECVSK